MSLKDEILNCSDLPLEKVEVPEWKKAVWVRTITAKERDDFEAASLKKVGKTREANLANLRARMVVLCACDEAGNRIFDDTDAAYVGNKNAKAVNRLYEVAQKLNGWTTEDIEELVKN